MAGKLRSKSQSSTKLRINDDYQDKTTVLMAKELGNESTKFVCLRHPKTDRSSVFCLSNNEKIMEVTSVKQGERSWFIGDSVYEDGRLLVATPVDPLFLLIPYLEKQEETSRVSPLEQLLSDDTDFPYASCLLALPNIQEQLLLVSDRKGAASLGVFKFNKEKFQSWFVQKLKRLEGVLQKRGINSEEGSTSATYVRLDGHVTSSDAYYTYAFGILGDYVSSKLTEDLTKSLGLEIKKRKVEMCAPAAKKTKLEEVGPSATTAKKATATPTLTAKEKALAKSARGTKSIASFFSKK